MHDTKEEQASKKKDKMAAAKVTAKTLTQPLEK